MQTLVGNDLDKEFMPAGQAAGAIGELVGAGELVGRGEQ